MGTAAASPPMAATRLAWVSMTPLGSPVVPEVYMITAKSPAPVSAPGKHCNLLSLFE